MREKFSERKERKGGSITTQASFKGLWPGFPSTSKTLIQKRCLLPMDLLCFLIREESGHRREKAYRRRKKIPTKIIQSATNRTVYFMFLL